MDFFRAFVRSQIAMSRALDRTLFSRMSVDGNSYYISKIRQLVTQNARVADVGGGKQPLFSPDEVARRGLFITGIDIDKAELARAPQGAYQGVIVSSLESLRGPSDHDFVIAQSVLEHVQDGRDAIRGCASLLCQGGHLFTFCPNRYAWFAIINRLLPEGIKRKILFGVFPEKRDGQGFPALYDGCTPRRMQKNLEAAGLDVVRVEYFFVSSYFMFFFPLYLVWRLLNWPLMNLWPSVFCETFIVTSVKGPRIESEYS